MNKIWLNTVLLISILLLALLKTQEVRTLNPYLQKSSSIKIEKFQKIKSTLSREDQELLELWESMLTGRSAPLSKWMKERYTTLGLNHLFTPSGFHLSAVLAPFMKFIHPIKWQLSILAIIGILLSFLPGQFALKRMVLIKGTQKIVGQKQGFIFAILLDCLIGGFQHSPLSFTYSFLFLSIIYSGTRGLGLAFWFFIAQVIIASFQGKDISPLLLLLSPILNFAFGITLPILFILSFPLWSWQLQIGLFLLRNLQLLVNSSSLTLTLFPSWEAGPILLIIFFLFIYRKWKFVLLFTLIFSTSLNLDLARTPSQGRYEGSHGKCKAMLVRGYWWKRCSPKRSTYKRTKKLSYL